MKHSQLLKNLLRVAGVGAAAATVAGLSTEALAGISNTKHNLTSNPNSISGKNYLTNAGTTEICVFCHTPHGSDTSAPAPLWNKKLPDGANFTTYASMGSSTLDAATAQTGSVSLACLSCHDGTQAMDNMMNAPGSGNYNSAGANYTTYDSNAGWTGNNVQSNGKLATNVVTNLGQDLKNDHPIGIVYCGGYTGSTCVDTDFKSPTKHADKDVWWVDTDGTGTGKSKEDIILYTRDFGGSQGAKGSVECASCHDPHVETKATGEVAFLRVSQASSGLCLACHTK